MFWVLWDISLPLIAVFLLGLLIGWLLWRWRRRRIDAEGLSKLRRESARNKADVERLQQSNIELSDRLQAASSAGGGDLASARKRIDMLAEELKFSRGEVAQLKSSERVIGGAIAGAGGSASDTSATADLQAQLKRACQRIVELEQSSVGSATSNSEVGYLRREIEDRDRMIATLNTSLTQFGETGDTTALMADVALRDRKIDELEALIATLNHK